jgi:ribosomal protein S18 acetylase RimI-like enzyme
MYTYRIATLSDLPTLRALWRDFIAETAVPYPAKIADGLDTFTRSVAIALAQTPTTCFAFLAEHAGEPIGLLLYEIQSRLIGEPQRYAFVHCAYVAPAHRARGVTGALATLATEHAIAQGISHGELSARPENPGWGPYADFTAFEVRYYAPTDLVLRALDRRRTARVRQSGNGLDHGTPLSPEQPEGAAREEEKP